MQSESMQPSSKDDVPRRGTTAEVVGRTLHSEAGRRE